MKTKGLSPEVFVVSEYRRPLMKHDERVFTLASQTSISIDLLHVCSIDLLHVCFIDLNT